MKLGLYEQAISIYEAVLVADPNRIGIWVNLANIRLQQGNNVQAIADMEVAKRLRSEPRIVNYTWPPLS